MAMVRKIAFLRSSKGRRSAGVILGLTALGLTVAGVVYSSGWVKALAAIVWVGGLPLAVMELRRLYATFRGHDLAMREAHDGLWSWYPVSKALNVGPRLLTLLGYTENLIPDTHAWLELVHPDDRGYYNQTVAKHLKGETPHFYCEYRVRARSGEYRWLASRGLALRNRRGVAYLMAGSVSDITERKSSEEYVRFLAHHDQLTGLANRLLLADYSSLSYLQQLPFDTLKIDRSFIQDIDAQRPDSETLVAAIIAMAKALGMHVVAEGVETTHQFNSLARLGCDTAQGYLFSPALADDVFVQRFLQPAASDSTVSLPSPVAR